MPEPAWNGADDGKAEFLPQCDGRGVRRDDEIELHGRKAEPPGFGQDVLAHRPADALSPCTGSRHETGIGDMAAAPGLVRPYEASSQHLAGVVRRHVAPRRGSRPEGEGLVFG